MKIICLSDTHNQHEHLSVPNGDILIHAGDITSTGEREDFIKFNDWLGRLPHKHKIVIAGNHDFYAENYPEETKIKPRLHVFGHIHEAYGQTQIIDTQYVNASVVGLNNFVGKSKLMKWLFKKAVSAYQIVKFIRKNIFKTPVEKLTPKSLVGLSWRVVNSAIVIHL